MKKPTSPCICRILHVLIDGTTVYHFGSGCRCGSNPEEAAHYTTDDPEGQAKMIADQLELADRFDCIDASLAPLAIKRTQFEIISRKNARPEDHLAFERRFGQVA